MTDPHYNLMDEPWLCVVDKAGKIAYHGIKHVLKHAHELDSIIDPSPLLEFGVYRMLVALVMDAFDISDTDKLAEALDAGQFDHETIDTYAERWHARFDLFDKERPFYQAPLPCPDLANKKKYKSPAQLFQHLPTGTNVIHFYHATEGEHAVGPGTCAKALCAIPAFMTMGGAGFPPSVNGAPPLYVLIKGENLFQTLLLNTCALTVEENNGNGPVAWRATNAGKREEITSTSTIQGLTWQPRHVHLIPGEGGKCTYTGHDEPVLVHEIVFEPGWKTRCTWRDPSVAYRITSDGTSPLRMLEGKDIWRDTGPLLLLQEHQYKSSGTNSMSYEKPVIVRQFCMLKNCRAIEKSTRLLVNVYGIRTDMKTKIFNWQKVALSLPIKLLDNPTAGEAVQENMERADMVARMFLAALKKAYPRNGEGNKQANKNLIQNVQRKFWNRLERMFNQDLVQFMLTLSPSDLDFKVKTKAEWAKLVQPVARELIDEALDPLDASAAEIKRVIGARNMFLYKIKQILDPSPPAVPAPGASPKKRKTTKHAVSTT